MKLINRVAVGLSAWLVLTIAVIAQSGRFTVQLEAAPTLAEAQDKVKQFKTKGVEAYIIKSQVRGKGTFYRVRVGVFPNQNEAQKFGADLRQQGVVSGFFIAPFERPREDYSRIPTSAPVPSKPNSPSGKDAVTAAPKNTAPNTAPPKNLAKDSVKSPVIESAPDLTKTAPTSKENSSSKPVTNNRPNEKPAAPAANFTRFQDPTVGYSFDHPKHWTGSTLKPEEAKAQRVNAGALFTSTEDAAFLNVIWNELDKANSQTNDNDLIVDVILRSMKQGDGTQQMEETSRRVVNEQGNVKTYLDLKARFQSPGQTAPLDFLGKAIIVRASRGILLVVAFYAKENAGQMTSIAEKVIASVRAPE
jgi:hypothetical protein